MLKSVWGRSGGSGVRGRQESDSKVVRRKERGEIAVLSSSAQCGAQSSKIGEAMLACGEGAFMFSEVATETLRR